MSTDAYTETVIRRVAADVLLTELLPLLYRAGWCVVVNAEGGFRSALADKASGRLYLPGGRDGRWHTQVAQVRLADTTPADRAGLLPEVEEVPAWRVELDQSVPASVVLTVAECAADGLGGIPASRPPTR